MLRVGFEPKIPVLERAKTVHDRGRGHCDRVTLQTSLPALQYSGIVDLLLFT
jgi:hypothetical protein